MKVLGNPIATAKLGIDRIVAETFGRGASVASVACKHDLNLIVLFGWRKDPRFAPAENGPASFQPAEVQVTGLDIPPSRAGTILLGHDRIGR